MEVSITDNTLLLKTKFEERDKVYFLRENFNIYLKWDSTNKVWVAPLTSDNLLRLWKNRDKILSKFPEFSPEIFSSLEKKLKDLYKKKFLEGELTLEEIYRKGLSPDEISLKEPVGEIDYSKLVKLELRDYQKDAVRRMLENKKFGLFLDMGLGKTITTIATLNALPNVKALIVLPSSIVGEWKKELKNSVKQFKIFDITSGTAEERKRKFKEFLDEKSESIAFLNYEALLTLFGLRGIGERVTRKLVKERILNSEFGKDINKINVLVFDEATKIKRPESKQSKVAYALSDIIDRVYVLTGNPAPERIEDLYGVTLPLKMFYGTKNDFIRRFGNYEEIQIDNITIPRSRGWKDEVAEKVVNDILSFASIRLRIEDVIKDLPSKTYIEKSIPLRHPEQIRAFRELSNQFYTILRNVEQLKRLGREKEAKLEVSEKLLPLVQKLQQVSGGFVYLESGAPYFYGISSLDDIDRMDNTEFERYLETNAKLGELIKSLEETQSKVVVFHHFGASGDLIERALKRKGINYVRIRMEHSPEERAKLLEKFNTDKDVKVILLSIKVGSHGLNLQVSPIIIYYENTLSYGEREQSERRIYRIGQEKPVFYIDLISTHIDKYVLELLKEKKDIGDALLSEPEKVRELRQTEPVLDLERMIAKESVEHQRKKLDEIT